MSTSQASPGADKTSYSSRLHRRLRALLLMEGRAYRNYGRLMVLQGEALEKGGYDLFLQRREAEEGILRKLAALDRVLVPLLGQRTRATGNGDSRDGSSEIALEESLRRLGKEVETARILALSENFRIQKLLIPVCRGLKDRLPKTKRISRFAGGSSGRTPRFIEISA